MTHSFGTERSRRWLAIPLSGILLLPVQVVSHTGYSVQIGAYADPDRASKIVESLNSLGLPASVLSGDSFAGNLSRVRVGPYADRESAEATRTRLESVDIGGFVVESREHDSRTTTGREPAAADSRSDIHQARATRYPAGQPIGHVPVMLAANAGDTSGSADSLEGLFGIEPEEPAEPATPGIGGFFNSKYAYTYTSPTHHSMFRNTLQLQTSGRLNEDVTWKASARGSYDAVFDIENFYSDRVEDNRRYEAAIHETYMDISQGDWEFRLGRQHIIWGEMVGLFFADVVSATDTRQWVAEDFDMIRIPQWAARAERYMGDLHAEAIWIPFMTYDRIGKPGDDFYPAGAEELPGVEQVFRNDNQPTQELSNSAYGLRLSMLRAGWDMSGFYYRSTDASPTFFREFRSGPDPVVIFRPDHKKIHQLGGTLAKDFRDFLLKAEAVYTLDRRFVVDDLSDSDGVEKQNTLDYIIGLEKVTMNGTRLNFQFFQRWYTDHDSDILYDELENGASIYTSTELTPDLEGELLLISSLNREDWMFRPRLNWDLSGNWELAFGADIFGGERKGLIGGRFDNSDRIYGQARFTF